MTIGTMMVHSGYLYLKMDDMDEKVLLYFMIPFSLYKSGPPSCWRLLNVL